MTSHSSGRPRVPDLTLERYRLGEMTPGETAALERRLRDDDEARHRLEALEASDGEIRQLYPPAQLSARVRQRLDAPAATAPHATGVASFLLRWRTIAALAGVMVLVVIGSLPLRGPGHDSVDRLKGLEPTLVIFRKTPGGSEQLQDGAAARAGDLIRIGYRASGRRWGVIVSVDGRGVVTRHLPRAGAQAAPLSADSQVLLESAYELDDAPRWERFYFVAAAAPFDATPVIEAARTVAAPGAASPPPALPLRMSVSQASVLLIKREAP